ncbi:hypothetical protein, partial [Alcanivorax borkumensis]|uniref:hypothetical protein n=1 Tax=Alcanivorax borkumensis TaxID=59754 RepID=UPI00356245B9
YNSVFSRTIRPIFFRHNSLWLSGETQKFARPSDSYREKKNPSRLAKREEAAYFLTFPDTPQFQKPLYINRLAFSVSHILQRYGGFC